MAKDISAYLVVYNEEKHIEKCLKSLVNVVAEIIVVHDGECSDKTLEIARKYGCQVFQKEHRGMGEFHRVFAIEQCKSEWVLQLDADEFLSKELQQKLSKLVQTENVDAYSFIWPLWNGKEYITKNFPYKKVLFRKSKMYYFTFPGSDPQTYGNEKNIDLVLEHRPAYDNFTLNTFNSKWKKWIKVQSEFYFKSDFECYNCNVEVTNKFKQTIEKQKKLAHKFLAPFWFGYSFFKSFVMRGYGKNLKTWKVALLQGLFGFYICLNISRIKNNT
jgi:glycosyltransferase involved in cell wall biosynthesis